MGTAISCYPPLAQATVIEHENDAVRVTVLLKASCEDAQPQISIWHNHNGDHEWDELRLQLLDGEEAASTGVVVPAGSETGDFTRQYCFTGTLSGLPKHDHTVSFTLKYKLAAHKHWEWSRDSTGLSDGQLIYQGCSKFREHSSYDLGHFFGDISPEIKVTREQAETSHTQLWSVTCPVNAAKGEDSGWQHHRLGKPSKCCRWFALVRLWSPWLAPRHGSGDCFELDKEGILLSFLRADGLHVVSLVIGGVQDVTSTFIHEDGNVVIKSRNEREQVGTSRILVAVAEDFEVANAAVMYHARRVVNTFATNGSDATAPNEIKALTGGLSASRMKQWYDGLTYCTWNGLGQALTAEKIYGALDELSAKKINVTNLIIDDNWQSLSVGQNQFQRGWSDFEANPLGFPGGLKATTQEIQRRHPTISHIAVWHALLGYWGGIDPAGAIANEYETQQVEKEPGIAGGRFTVVAPDDVGRMYDDFYSFLSSRGVDAVKTDAQFFLDLLLHAPARRGIIKEYLDAWTIAHLRHFSGRAIGCMSQFPQSLFHNQLTHDKPVLVVRNSDDFFPGVEASHAWHIFCNAHNSLLTQHLNVLPDWDMFQTSHPWAAFHAAARCVSGGPISITDKPGEHNIALIQTITATTIRDETIVLRPHRVGKTICSVYNPYEAHGLLKIGTYVGMARSGSGIIGCFNVSGTRLNELITFKDFPGTEHGSYIVRSYRSGACYGPMSRGGKLAFLNLAMDSGDWDILTASPVQSFAVHGASTSVALLGLIGKMTGIAALTGSKMNFETNGRLRISVQLKALGTFGLWIGDLEARSVDENFMVTIFGKPIRASNARVDGKVLLIDVASAWEESGETAGWTNEVPMEIFMQ